MSEDNKKTRTEKNAKKGKKNKKNKKKLSIFRLIIVVILMVAFIGAGATAGLVFATIKGVPDIDTTSIYATLNENSVIYDENGNTIEKIQTEEFRTVVDLDKIPVHLRNAFIAIEDERFGDHPGVDVRGILGAIFDYVKSGGTLRGASTITQQLARDLYLSKDRQLERKIKEAYIALQLERQLSKDQILEAYLNRIYLGQGAYGVQEAAQTYFSKNVEDLTIAESALIAGITKNPSRLDPYKLLYPEDVDTDKHHVVGHVDILGERYTAIFNDAPIERQRVILSKMKELNYITETEYDEAIKQDMQASIKPGQKKLNGISSYFTDYVKTQVVNDLIEKEGYSKEDAEKELYTGGLKIYTTMDINLQHKIEDIYSNFGEILFGDLEKQNNPILVEWKRYTGGSGNLDGKNNLVNEKGKLLFYQKSNLLDEEGNLIIEKGTFDLLENGNLTINNRKLNIYPKTVDINDYYTIDDKKNLVTHTVGSLDIANDSYSIDDNNHVILNNSFITKNEDFYRIDENGNLLINPKYFYSDDEGIVQPQSSVVIIDHRTGKIRALVGGRDIEGSRLFNRATSPRQPGSSIKPLSVYLPALDNGYTAASIIDDVPYYDNNGNRWPKNWYSGQTYSYWGLTTLRQSVEQSINVNSVKVVESIGINRSKEYLTKLGIIKEDGNDSFVTREDNNRTNDENLSALGLGGMSKGLSPLDMTAAYGAIANQGIYTEPIAYTQVLDRNGNVLLENKPKKISVVNPDVAYLMTDILRTTVTNGLANRAKIDNIPVAGKTGTTQDNGDIWFAGFSPYYTAAVWIGNDVTSLKLSSGSTNAARYWSHIMNAVHEGLEQRNFEMPQGLVTRQICTISGKLATDLCSRDPRGSTVRTEMFIKGTEPTEYCDLHVEVAIDTSTGKLATEDCPPELVENKVFVNRNPAYNPEEHDGIVPRDYQYSVPTEECDEHQYTNPFDDWFKDLFGNDQDDSNEDTENEPDDTNDQDHDNNDNNENEDNSN